MLLVVITVNGHAKKVIGPYSNEDARKAIDCIIDTIGKSGIESGLDIVDCATKEERQSFMTTRDGSTFIELGRIFWNKTPAIKFEFTLHNGFQCSDEGCKPLFMPDIENMIDTAIAEYYNLHQTQMLVEKACENTHNPTDLPAQPSQDNSLLKYIINTFIDGEFICASQVISGSGSLLNTIRDIERDIQEYLKKEGFEINISRSEKDSRYDTYEKSRRYITKILAHEPTIPMMCYTDADKCHLESWPKTAATMTIVMVGCEVIDERDKGATILSIERALEDKCWEAKHRPSHSPEITRRKEEFKKLQTNGIPMTKIPWTPEMDEAWSKAAHMLESDTWFQLVTEDTFDKFTKLINEYRHSLITSIERVIKKRREAAAVPPEKLTTPIGEQHPFGFDRE